MFETVINTWREARARELRREVEDAVLRLNAIDQKGNMLCCLAMADMHVLVAKQFGDLSHISSKGKKRIVKTLLAKAKARFEFNMPQGHGIFLYASYIESQILTGMDAAFAKQELEKLLVSALEVRLELDKQEGSGSN